MIVATLLSRFDVVDLQEARPSAPGRPTAMKVTRQYLPAYSGRDRGCVAASVFTDCGVASHSLDLGKAQFALTGVSLDGHSSGGRVFVNVDLDRRPTGKRPPGA